VGYSVLDVVHAFERANELSIPLVFAPRRAGDLPAYWADAEKAARLLHWRTRRGLEQMCADSWRWQRNCD